MKLSILIVNYNTESHIKNLLHGLLSQDYSRLNFEIILMNNSQNSLLADMIKQENFEESFRIKIIESSTNLGFGKGVNLAAGQAVGEYLLLMNPDILMMQSDYLTELIAYADPLNDFGVISTNVLDGTERGDIATFYSYEFGKTLGFDNQICWFQGSLMLIKSEVFQLIGGFDDDFFMYCEDVDLCYRLKKKNLELIKCDWLAVYHIGGVSEPLRDLDFYVKYFKSRWLFAHKHLDKKEFDLLLQQQAQKCRYRIWFYSVLGIFSKRHRDNYNKNKAMHMIISAINTNSAQWLYD